MSTIGSRLREWRESLGMSRRELAIRLAMTEQSLGRYERDERVLQADDLAKALGLGLDVVWLLTGRAGGQPQFQEGAGTNLSLPRYDARLSAGPGFSEPDRDEGDALFVSEDFVRRSLRRAPKGLVVARASGSSMAPTILDGDLLVIDTVDQRLQNGRIYALSVDGDLFVKRISKTLRGEIVLKSDNPDAGDPPELVSDDIAARVIGQVIWHGGSLE